jgi:hypothetical protein
LFERLAAMAGSTVWIERSGSSVDYVSGLLATFDDARFVHLHRDGREVALSMRRHPFFRVAVQLSAGYVPDGVDPSDEEAVVTAWLEGDPPIELFGGFWSDQLEHGEATLRDLGPDRVLGLAFEDLVADPAPHLERIADFFELADDEAFTVRAAALVRGVPPRRRDALDDETRARLDASCVRGDEVLARLAT